MIILFSKILILLSIYIDIRVTLLFEQTFSGWLYVAHEGIMDANGNTCRYEQVIAISDHLTILLVWCPED